MSHVIVYETTNKLGEPQIAIITPTAECGLTVEQIASKDVPEGVSYIIIDSDTLPNNREHRGAWELRNGAVVVNQIKAQAITDAKTAKETQRQIVLNKLGLTADEVNALLG